MESVKSIKSTSSMSYTGSFKRSIPVKQQNTTLVQNITIPSNPTPKSPYRTTSNLAPHPLDSINVSRMSKNSENPSIDKKQSEPQVLNTEYDKVPRDTVPDITNICETRVKNVK